MNINTAESRCIATGAQPHGRGRGQNFHRFRFHSGLDESGDNPRLAGAKSDYYQRLDPPYYAKNAPMDDLSELLLVRGIGDHPEIYWGGSATNHAPAAFQQKLGFGNSPFQAPDYPFGLKDVFTPISSGHININTADDNVLQMLPGVDDATAQNIIKLRAGPDGVDGTDDDTPLPADLSADSSPQPSAPPSFAPCAAPPLKFT